MDESTRAMYRQGATRGTLSPKEQEKASAILECENWESIEMLRVNNETERRQRLEKERTEREGKTAAPVPLSKQITTHSDFDHSEFCQQFHCRETDSRSLQNGDTNHTYSTTVDNLSVEVATKDQLVTMLGLMFLERGELSSPEFAVVESLLGSTNRTRQHEAALSFIKQNVEKPVPQIRKAQFTTDGHFRIWAGKVGPEQVVAFERVPP